MNSPFEESFDDVDLSHLTMTECDGYTEVIGGWLEDEEDTGWIKNLQSGEILKQLFSGGERTYSEIAFDPRDKLQVENQRNQGACQGHAISSCVEFCYYLATADFDMQLSRAMGYYETQRIDGIRGDRGSTISGGVKLAITTGICEERLWTYPSSYNPRRPADYQKILNNADKFKIVNQIRLRSYEEIRTFIGSGQGAISIGIGWNGGMSKAVVESYSSGGGGHAIGLFALSERKDRNGNPYIWMKNSWGERFGNRGWSEWSPRAVEQMCRSGRTVAIGISDMKNVKARRIEKGGFINSLNA